MIYLATINTSEKKYETVSINELLPFEKKITEILTGSELLLAYELDKYARVELNKQLILSDVSIATDLLSEEIFSFVVNKGLNVGFIPDPAGLADYSKSKNFFFVGTVEGVTFKRVSPDEVVFEIESDDDANRVLRGEHHSAAHVSLVAYQMVLSKRDGVPIPKLIVETRQTISELAYVDIFILKIYGNQLLQNLVEFKPEYKAIQPEWEAFVIYHRQRSLMKTESLISEKYCHLQENFEFGDVVLLYSRAKVTEKNSMGILKSCFTAVITHFDENTVKVTHYPIVKTRLTHQIELDNVESDLAIDSIDEYYLPDDTELFSIRTETYPYTEIGVGTCIYNEKHFIIKPVDTDGSYQYIKTDSGVKRIWLSTLDTIYAVFEDRKVRYNKEKFLQEYFYSMNRQPIYNTYTGLNKIVNSKEDQVIGSKRGGRRTGAGRRSLGVKKPVSITLPEDAWNEIDNLIQSGSFKSYAEYFRSLVADKQ